MTLTSLLSCMGSSCRALCAVLKVPVEYDIDITVLEFSEHIFQYIVNKVLNDALVWPLNNP